MEKEESFYLYISPGANTDVVCFIPASRVWLDGNEKQSYLEGW